MKIEINLDGGLFLSQPPMQFTVCDGFNHYEVDLLDKTLNKSGKCTCGKTNKNKKDNCNG